MADPEALEPDAAAARDEEDEPKAGASWQTHLLLFVVTTASMFITGALSAAPAPPPDTGTLGLLLHGVRHIHLGASFAIPLMAILLTHEFGHYFAAMYHRVPASLPYFIPLPLLSPFGTMGAVIAMPDRIRSRNALLDIGAAGPLAGLVVAIPVLFYGLTQSKVGPLVAGGMMEGQCLLYSGMKYLVHGAIPPGHDVFLSPIAFAGWVGLLVTMLNLLPIGQLDGGHIAYALFEKTQFRIARVLHALLLAAFAYNYVTWGSYAPGAVWLLWFVLLLLMRRAAGEEHPPTEPGELTPGRKGVAVLCLVLFVVLFMPTPLRIPMRVMAVVDTLVLP